MSPTDPTRPAAPTTAEVAELTARLREISARGPNVDPAERARFLADKNALIARITAIDSAEAGRGELLQDRPWLAQGVTVDTAHHQITDDGHSARGDANGQRGEPVMPEWMRERARRTEAEIAAGTYAPGPPNDPAQIAARIAALREQVAARDPEELAEERREQLNRWHTDDTEDTADDADTLTVPVIVTDDGPVCHEPTEP